MTEFNYIAPSILLVFAFFSIFYEPYRWAALIITSAQSFNFLLMDKWEAAQAAGSLDGVFFFATLSISVMLSMVLRYTRDKKDIYLSFARCAGLMGVTHILYISSFSSNFFDTFTAPLTLLYNNYYVIQLLLTIYMICLFGKSGITGMDNVKRAAYYAYHTSGRFISNMGIYGTSGGRRY